MQIDKLQIELRPRSPAQALDLGFALLRSRPYAVYMSYAMLLLPFIALAVVLTLAFPAYAFWFVYIPWWVKPIIERGPLYVLSRQVFGTSVSWQEAVRAWPGQLGGGAISLLTWLRPFSAGRSFYQPVWQLEHARGAVASERRRALGASGTARSAFWFGLVCAHLELIVYLGLGYFAFSLLDSETSLQAIWYALDSANSQWLHLAQLGMLSLVMILFGPIYTACGFTLYLNRRAALEAWDIELKLRQITPPATHRGGMLATVLGVLLCLGAGSAPDAMAAPASTREACLQAQLPQRLATADPEQQRIRRQVDALFAHDSLRERDCVENWVRTAKPDEKKKAKSGYRMPNLDWLASLLQVLAIAGAVGTVAWLLYRYRDHFPAFRRGPQVALATEVGGLDIRAESLPPDITAEVQRLWQAGQRRAALALLYRATLSRMVSDDKLLLRQGDTEGDCLRAATRACREQRLSQARLEIAGDATAMWLAAAYGNRWPHDEQVSQCCAAWQGAFATRPGSSA